MLKEHQYHLNVSLDKLNQIEMQVLNIQDSLDLKAAREEGGQREDDSDCSREDESQGEARGEFQAQGRARSQEYTDIREEVGGWGWFGQSRTCFDFRQEERGEYQQQRLEYYQELRQTTRERRAGPEANLLHGEQDR